MIVCVCVCVCDGGGDGKTMPRRKKMMFGRCLIVQWPYNSAVQYRKEEDQ